MVLCVCKLSHLICFSILSKRFLDIDFVTQSSVQIVPGYYLRRNTDGCIENSTCVNNTASEHFMVERLILDDLLCWAVHYKVIIDAACTFV